MSVHGFGFSASNEDRDDDRENNASRPGRDNRSGRDDTAPRASGESSRGAAGNGASDNNGSADGHGSDNSAHASGSARGAGHSGSNGNRTSGSDSRTSGDNDSATGPNNIFDAFAQMFGGSSFAAFPGGFSIHSVVDPSAGGNTSGSGNTGANPNDLFGSLSGMFAGFQEAMNDAMKNQSEGGEHQALNLTAIEKAARQHISEESRTNPRLTAPSEGDDTAVRDATQLVTIWLDDATALDRADISPTVCTPTQWLVETLPTWQKLMSPIAQAMQDAQLETVPEELRSAVTTIMAVFGGVNGMNVTQQLSASLANLALRTVSTTEWGIPLARHSAILPWRLDDLSTEFGQPAREVLIYLCAREAAHQRLFARAGWLDERIILAVENYSKGVHLDTAAIDEAMRDIEGMQGDPNEMMARMQEFMEASSNPEMYSDNPQAAVQLDTLLSLIEGWVDAVVATALFDRIPVTKDIHAAWCRYRTEHPALSDVASGVGLNLTPSRADDAALLWNRLTAAVGVEARDNVWNHPDFLPVATDLDHPARFIDAQLAAQDADDFDPISEIKRLEDEGK